jgi:hypothetical protein
MGRRRGERPGFKTLVGRTRGLWALEEGSLPWTLGGSRRTLVGPTGRREGGGRVLEVGGTRVSPMMRTDGTSSGLGRREGEVGGGPGGVRVVEGGARRGRTSLELGAPRGGGRRRAGGEGSSDGILLEAGAERRAGESLEGLRGGPRGVGLAEGGGITLHPLSLLPPLSFLQPTHALSLLPCDILRIPLSLLVHLIEEAEELLGLLKGVLGGREDRDRDRDNRYRGGVRRREVGGGRDVVVGGGEAGGPRDGERGQGGGIEVGF